MENSNKEYQALFELGVVNDNPAVKIVGDFSVCPTTLAALVVTLFETVMKSVDESDQIDYEKYFNKSLKVIMKERHNYEVTYKYIESEDEE
jgi:hypothetical protein